MRIRFVVCLVIVGMSGPAHAEGLFVSSKSRTDLLRSQLNVLDNRAATQYSGSVRLQPPKAIIPGTPGALAIIDAKDSPYLVPAQTAAKTYGIPEGLFIRLIQQESGWNPAALSPKGAIGLAQLMPGTARLLKVDPQNPSENLNGGARYLRMMFDRFGSWNLALAAYNAGPEAVAKYNGIPPYAETQNYVQVILATP